MRDLYRLRRCVAASWLTWARARPPDLSGSGSAAAFAGAFAGAFDGAAFEPFSAGRPGTEAPSRGWNVPRTRDPGPAALAASGRPSAVNSSVFALYEM